MAFIKKKSMKNRKHYIERLLKQYRGIRIAEIFLLSAALAFVIYSLSALLRLPLSGAIVSASVVSVLVFVFLLIKGKVFKTDLYTIVRFMNKRYARLEQSAELLIINDTELPALQVIQQERVIKAFDEIQSQIKFPNQLLRCVVFVIASAGVAMLVSFNTPDPHEGTSALHKGYKHGVTEPPLPPSIKSIDIHITPPAYTGLNAFESKTNNLEIQEQSMAKFSVHFSQSVNKAWIIFSGDTVALTQPDNSITKTFTTSGFYQIAWQVDTIEKSSDFYKIEVIPDRQPHVSVVNLPQFSEYSIKDKTIFTIKSSMSDDYGLSDAYIIATVSKGSGESVKFREEKLRFTTPSMIKGKKLSASRNIDLIKLGMEPGDELYFYVEALDNKQPAHNRARTETYFIQLLDTAKQELSVEGGLGVDLMPEYFRSQRQIIIDSEKLLKEKSRISKEEFNSRSNELGYDQKVLRLKYGEFLGEEFESGIGIQASAMPQDDEHGEEEEEDVTKKYGHVHDTENEHNLVPEKKTEEPDHDHEEHAGHEEESPISQYMHVHDDPEEATFFSQSIRAKLKAALTVMWDAELHLRLFDPKTSLPYQYKALKLLKEISNDSRIYVHKTGFDPPPIKEEKRLTGDLSEAKSSRQLLTIEASQSLPNIRAAIMTLEEAIVSRKQELSSTEKVRLQKAGSELAALALKNPERYLDGLTLTKNLIESNKINTTYASKLLLILSKALPQQVRTPAQQARNQTPLDRVFIEKLDALER
jgi:hypothetical protein